MCELQRKQANLVQCHCRQCCILISATDKKLFEKLSEDAKNKMRAAVSTLEDVNHDLVDGNIKISLLKVILEKREAYLDLLKIGNNRHRVQIDLAADGLQ